MNRPDVVAALTVVAALLAGACAGVVVFLSLRIRAHRRAADVTALVDALWPPGVVGICGHAGDALPGYESFAAARAAITGRGQRVRPCKCGLFHIRRTAPR